jgi:hypothetical protein
MGVFIFLVSFLGWYSSTRENRTLLLVVRRALACARAHEAPPSRWHPHDP